jgi:hypothetical protein
VSAVSEVALRAAVVQLRTELAAVVDQLGPYAPPPHPSRFDRLKNAPKNGGPVWDVPADGHRPQSRCLSVRAVDLDEPPRCVYIEGGDFSYGGDWTALTTHEARALAMALLAAADWADDADPLHKRRVEADEARQALSGGEHNG